MPTLWWANDRALTYYPAARIRMLPLRKGDAMTYFAFVAYFASEEGGRGELISLLYSRPREKRISTSFLYLPHLLCLLGKSERSEKRGERTETTNGPKRGSFKPILDTSNPPPKWLNILSRILVWAANDQKPSLFRTYQFSGCGKTD